jgi:hypothetical protein
LALLTNDVLTFADWASRHDRDGTHSKIAEVMSRKDEAFGDIMFMEANQELSHRDTLRSELPLGQFRAFNEGVGRGKSKTRQIVDDIANLQLYGLADKDLADLSGDAASFRFREEKGVIQGITQQFMDTLWYGNRLTDPKEFTGFANRYNDITDDRVISAGGSATLSSIWLIVWGDDSVRGIFPKGMSDSTGLSVTDKGVETVDDGTGSGDEYEAYRTHYKLMAGLSVKDYRQIVRICNVDVAAMSAGALVDLLIEAVSWIEDPAGLKIYMNRETWTRYNIEAKNDAHLSISEIDGKKQVSFWDYPLRRSDSLISLEDQLV